MKLENVLITDDLEPEIIDFGFCDMRKDIREMPYKEAKQRGTKMYMAPEIREENHHMYP